MLRASSHFAWDGFPHADTVYTLSGIVCHAGESALHPVRGSHCVLVADRSARVTMSGPHQRSSARFLTGLVFSLLPLTARHWGPVSSFRLAKTTPPATSTPFSSDSYVYVSARWRSLSRLCSLRHSDAVGLVLAASAVGSTRVLLPRTYLPCMLPTRPIHFLMQRRSRLVWGHILTGWVILYLRSCVC